MMSDGYMFKDCHIHGQYLAPDFLHGAGLFLEDLEKVFNKYGVTCVTTKGKGIGYYPDERNPDKMRFSIVGMRVE